MRQVIFDTETTGLDPNQGHRIIEVGAIEMINRRKTGRTYHKYFKPDREVDAGQWRYASPMSFSAPNPVLASWPMSSWSSCRAPSWLFTMRRST
jgi:hypothetical protein